jgi:hypothetical protein
MPFGGQPSCWGNFSCRLHRRIFARSSQIARREDENDATGEGFTTIAQRSLIDGVLCDVVCTGRFYDFLERRNGRWGLVLRQPIYEKDRVDPVDSAAHIELYEALLSQFPSGYRHPAYVQTKAGYAVNRQLPGLDGPEVDAFYHQGAGWLRGDACATRCQG